MAAIINTINIKSKLELFETTISFEDARKLIGLRYITFYTTFRKDNIRYERIGKRKIQFQKQDILNYIEAHKVGDWSQVNPEDITSEDKVDINQACNIIGISSYDTFYSIMRRNNLPRFQYNTKIVFYKCLIQKYKESCRRDIWRKEQ